MPVGRLFVEVGKNVDAMNESLRRAIKSGEEAGVKITGAGKSIISKFNDALNPCEKLREKIELLQKAGKSQAEIMKVMGDEINETARKTKAMGQPVDDLIKKFTSFESKLKATGEGLMNFGKSMSMYVTAPIVAAAAAAFKAANDLDRGIDKIRIGTGATGVVLKNLTEDMKAVWGTIPQGIEQISIAIATLNTRLALTGEPLRQMSIQMLNLARMSNSEVAPMIAAATRLFGDWSVATEKQSQALDYMFKVSQKTGISTQYLMEIIVQYGAPLRALGFDIETAAVAMGKWEKEGVNMETILAGLRFGLGEFAKAGKDPVQALKNIEAAIKGASSETKAIAIAFEVFGKRAGPDLGRAILEGRFSFDQLKKSVLESRETINAAAEDVKSFSQRMAEMKEKFEKAILPIGEKLIKSFETLQPQIISCIDSLASAIKKFSELDSKIQAAALATVAFAAVIGPLAFAMGGLLKISTELIKAAEKYYIIAAALQKIASIVLIIGSVIAGWKIAEWIDDLDLFQRHTKAAANAIIEETRELRQKAVDIGAVDAAMAKYKTMMEEGIITSKTFKGVLHDLIDRRLTESAEEYRNRLKTLVSEFVSNQEASQKFNRAGKDSADVLNNNTSPAVAYLSDELAKLLKISKQMDSPQLHQFWKDSERVANEAAKATSNYRSGLEKYLIPSLETQEIAARNATAQMADIALKTFRVADASHDAGEEFQKFNDEIAKGVIEQTAYDAAELSEAMDKGKDSVRGLGYEVSTAFSNMTQEISERLTQWAGKFQSFAKLALNAILEGLLSPLNQALRSIGVAISNLLSGLWGGGARASGGGAIAGAGLGLGASFAGLLPAGVVGGSLAGVTSGNVYGQVAGGIGLAGTGLAGIASIATGMPLLQAMGLLFTNPWTAVVAGGVLGITALIKSVMGKSTEQAGAMEVYRDLGIQFGKDAFKAFYEGIGLSESAAWGIRKDIYMSPKFLVEQALPVAEATGQLDTLLRKLERVQTAWGTFDFRTAFELGRATGDWAELNRVFKEAFESSERLKQALPDWENILAAAAEALKTELDLLKESLNALILTIQGSITPVQTMYDKFLLTGEITEEFAEQIKKLGGELQKFQQLAGLGLELQGLQAQLNFIQSLRAAIASLAPQLDPINQILKGHLGPEAITALTKAGLEPARFESLMETIRMQTSWGSMAKPFGALTSDLKSALLQYGGPAGQLAVERYAQGFNTITQALLEQTKAAMDKAYENAVRDALEYIGQMEKETIDKMDLLIRAIDDAKIAVVAELQKMVHYAELQAATIEQSVTQTGSALAPSEIAYYAEYGGEQVPIPYWGAGYPGLQRGGRVEKTGIAIVHEGEEYSGLGGRIHGGPVINLINPVFYGWNDFVEKVRQAGADLGRRGDPAWV